MDGGPSIPLGVRPAGRRGSGRSAVLARNGMVAASQPLAAQAGLRILQQGGNAIDAAIAAAASLAVVEPMMTGPGGDMFALAYIADTEELVGLNGSGFSPRAVDVDFFRRRGLESIPTRGAFSVTIPGAVDGWATLLDKYGTMTFSQVLEPAIHYAEKGFPVSEAVASDWARYGESYEKDSEFVCSYYLDGKPPAHGDVFVNQPLAETFRKIAEGGRDAFYKGDLARNIVDCLNGRDWPVSMDDMAYQHSNWVEPISTTYRGRDVYELPPNGQGIAALEMLNILEGFDLANLSHNSAPYLHLLIEAKKLAFADLDAWLADPQHVKIPVASIVSKDYAERQRGRIDLQRAATDVTTGINEPVQRLRGASDTTYLTVVDNERNVVSFINSLFTGSGIVVPGTGILLQNRGALFSVDPDHPNRIEGRKRPFHTIIPAMVFKDGKPWLSFGVVGGPVQPQGQVQVLLNMIDFRMNVQDAGEAPRFRHDGVADVGLESGVEAAVVSELQAMGHSIVQNPGSFGGYQGIQIDWEEGILLGGSDPRKDGLVAAW